MKLEEVISGMLEEIKRIEEVDKEDSKKAIENLIKQRDKLIVVANEKENTIEELERCIDQHYRTKQVQEGIIVDKQSKIEELEEKISNLEEYMEQQNNVVHTLDLIIKEKQDLINKEVSQLTERLERQATTISRLLKEKSELLEYISKIYGLAYALSK